RTEIAVVKKQYQQLGVRCKELLGRFYFRNQSLREIAAAFAWTEASANRRLATYRLFIERQLVDSLIAYVGVVGHVVQTERGVTAGKQATAETRTGYLFWDADACYTLALSREKQQADAAAETYYRRAGSLYNRL